ncbi:ExsB protein [Campylobacter sputorum subsp. bubulus]|uniref:7-cyano-7-deazaguanine synthase n=1 Tax=Campylobacter sputorum subsp. sputorum TaxID=32024 RepID=A0A381DL46_9BACT|nr:7-cyano-7-deazaguanine synthase QueC [Campylobacter sputorum]ASM34643.1 7-cyano-7-deazaguanine synthase [Campylobacter sputorum aubsp. sputorum RM3237]ASM36306.1 7-cyano-7-deazaguanine synthase [Campylobacter sputorum bv. faecalis CCUG 20703]KAB0581143.1 7-cyano-7-deazaguanine synthase QueC [Campylobacter sputorum subsp. sputorum]QEL04834.1 7-cyano-7-deazaguanine synthase [Campylobacter sputorum subsp. sputorum]SUX09837.1 ExsB protein [Campylobacter sputorum subsp. bubulus]
MKKALCIISGGMDSTLCAYMAKNEGYEIVALHFDYNQRTMNKERECFNKICNDLNIKKREILDVSFISQIGANALTDTNLEIPKTGISDDIPITYVPFRNGVFLSIAAALAQKENCDAIFIGVVEEDSSGYPDCSEEFIKSMQLSINLGRGTKDTKIVTPLVHLSKADIVKKAISLNVPLELTWSCYESEDKACGKCDSCRLRLNGFKKAGFKDKIPYKE